MDYIKPKGVIPPVVTPFDKEGNVNYPVLRQMINYLIDAGVHGLFLMGTTGEFYAVSDKEYEEVIRVAMEEAKGRVPIYAGANHITTRGVIAQIKILEKLNVDCVSVLTTMFVSQTQAEVYEFYKTIANSTKLPIMIYNNKPKTNVHVEPATVAKLAEIENIIGIKDSTGDMTNTIEYIRLTRHVPNFYVLAGRDTLIYGSLMHGAAGTISSCSNVAPKVAVAIYENFIKGNLKEALEQQMRYNPLRLACNMGTFPAVIKEGLNQMGIPVGKCLDPIQELTQDEKSKLHQVLKDLDLVA